MTDSNADHVTWPPPPGDNPQMPDEGGAWSAWAVRLTRRSDGEETFVDCEDSSEAHDQAAQVRGFAGLDIEVVSRIAMALPWQPTPGEAPSAAQLADLVSMSAGALFQLATSGLLTSGDAAEIPGKLQVALDHIGETISSAAVRDALPEAAQHLDVAAARSMGAAHLIRLAEPAMSSRRQAGRRLVDFPDDVNPAAPGERGTSAHREPGAAGATKGVRPS